jgi:signal transduction histidine kinase
MLLSFGIGSSLAFWLDHHLRRALRWGDGRLLSIARAKVISLARTEPHCAKLAIQFESLLRSEFAAPVVTILVDEGGSHLGRGMTLSKKSPAHASLCEITWATPESLERRRRSPSRDDLRMFLQTHAIGAIVTTPCANTSPSLIIAVGMRHNEWPFTYPEIVRLQSLAELIDNILTHSRLTEHSAIRAKMEHFAMMSRGLAHDLNNLITPVSSFLIHTDGKYAADSVEAEVHSAARRSVRIMSDYVREALFFSERCAPRFEQIDVNILFQKVRDVTEERARDGGVELAFHSMLSEPAIGDAILLQRMLANLVANAIDASSGGKNVAVRVEQAKHGWYRLLVIDQGCGIAPDDQKHIFEPYFTTKQVGDTVRGFGLGLTISQKIAALHGGTIRVCSRLGEGTTMTVELPTIPLLTPASTNTGPSRAEEGYQANW